GRVDDWPHPLPLQEPQLSVRGLDGARPGARGDRRRRREVYQRGLTMCGIIGFLDKRGGPDHPLGRTLLGMLQALSCRGPDSAGVAVFGPPQARWIVQIKAPEGADPQASAHAVFDALRDVAVV